MRGKFVIIKQNRNDLADKDALIHCAIVGAQQLLYLMAVTTDNI